MVETRYPEALSIFSECGFITSYYLPFDLVIKEKDELEKEIKGIKEILIKQQYIGISTSFVDYEIVAKYFPHRKKYIWILVPTYNTQFFKIRKILNDTSVQVVLIDYKAVKGNR